MAAKLRRHLKRQIDSGMVELPEELHFLAKTNYFAIAEQRVQYIRDWYVEIKGASLRPLLDVKKKLSAARLSNRTLTAENLRLEDELAMLNLRDVRGGSNRVAAPDIESGGSEPAQESAVEIAQRRMIRDLEGKVESLRSELAQLDENLQRINANIEEDTPHDTHTKSPKNFFNKIEESGLLPTGPDIQGGSGGSGKR